MFSLFFLFPFHFCCAHGFYSVSLFLTPFVLYFLLLLFFFLFFFSSLIHTHTHCSQAEIERLRAAPEFVEATMQQGAARARAIAHGTMIEVKDAVGLGPSAAL